jgi:hypothetical protein
MTRYRTFKRSCNSFEEMAMARKIEQRRGLNIEQARQHCADYNDHRTAQQISKGTKMEFESY